MSKTTHPKLQRLKPETLEILAKYPMCEEQLITWIDQPPIPADTLIRTYQMYACGIMVYSEIDGQVTLDVQYEGDYKSPEVIEMAINGELAMVKVGDEPVLDRTQLIEQAHQERQAKRDAAFANI